MVEKMSWGRMGKDREHGDHFVVIAGDIKANYWFSKFFTNKEDAVKFVEWARSEHDRGMTDKDVLGPIDFISGDAEDLASGVACAVTAALQGK